MAQPHTERQFHFVSITDPSLKKDPAVRKAIRRHIMQEIGKTRRKAGSVRHRRYLSCPTRYDLQSSRICADSGMSPDRDVGEKSSEVPDPKRQNCHSFDPAGSEQCTSDRHVVCPAALDLGNQREKGHSIRPVLLPSQLRLSEHMFHALRSHVARTLSPRLRTHHQQRRRLPGAACFFQMENAFMDGVMLLARSRHSPSSMSVKVGIALLEQVSPWIELSPSLGNLTHSSTGGVGLSLRRRCPS